jgi:hypothetical protein
MSYLETMGADYPPFQLDPERREWLCKHGTVTNGEIVIEPGETQGEVVDGDVICYYGMDEAVSREKGMKAIEATPAWVLKAIESHVRGKYAQRETAIWPDTVWDVRNGIKSVLSMNHVDDEIMPLKDRKALLNYGAPLVSRFLIREETEYGETHFIGIRRRKSELPHDKLAEMENPSYGAAKNRWYVLDDYLFPELRDMTADTITSPFTSNGANEEEHE